MDNRQIVELIGEMDGAAAEGEGNVAAQGEGNEPTPKRLRLVADYESDD